MKGIIMKKILLLLIATISSTSLMGKFPIDHGIPYAPPAPPTLTQYIAHVFNRARMGIMGNTRNTQPPAYIEIVVPPYTRQPPYNPHEAAPFDQNYSLE